MPARLNLEVPPARDVEDLRSRVNDSLRRVQEELEAPVKLRADLDAQGRRITNLGEPESGRDAVSRDAGERRWAALRGAAATSISVASSVAGARANAAPVVTSSARLLLFSVPGTLSIRSSAAPLVSLPAETPVTAITALLKRAPSEVALRVAVALDGEEWRSIEVEPGRTRADVELADAVIPAGAVVSIDITQVGLVFPGADLTVQVR